MRKLLILILLAGMMVLPACTKGNDSGKLIWHGDRSSNHVYMTFDDGPDPKWTPKVLDILKKHHIKATFFLLGERANRYPEIVRRIQNEGHEIGSHTYTHSDGYNADDQKIRDELIRTDKTIKKITGSPPKYFRPPFGFFNYRYFRIAEDLGYKIILWSFDVGDWNNLSAEELTNKLTSQAMGGSIILLHDKGENKQALISALRKAIKQLKAKGLEFSSLSKLSP